VVHEGVTKQLLGRSTKHMLPEALALNEKMMVDLNLEYYNQKTRTPFSSIGYFSAENDFFHPWSLEQIGEHYGYHKLKELMDPKDFLTLPAVVVDEFLEAVSSGLNKREKAEAAKREQQARQQGLPKDQLDLLNKAGIDPKQIKV
jgi:hypothetical protein